MPIDRERYWPEQRDHGKQIAGHGHSYADSTRVCATRLAEQATPTRRRRDNGALLAVVAALRVAEPGLTPAEMLARLAQRGVTLPGRLRRFR